MPITTCTRCSKLYIERSEEAALAMVRRLEALGFGDEDASISGADAIDAINDHFSSLREALAL